PQLVQAPTESAAPRRSWLQCMSCRKLLHWLDNVAGGQIDYSDSSVAIQFGESSLDCLQADWTIDDPRFFSHLATNGSIGFAESYLQGHWRSNDLTAL